MAQIVFGVQNEWATTISDILIQRTQLFYRQKNQALGVIEKVADFMATLLSWTPEEKKQQIRRYQHDVKQSRHWQSGFPELT